jgi:hypothetical protein
MDVNLFAEVAKMEPIPHFPKLDPRRVVSSYTMHLLL